MWGIKMTNVKNVLSAFSSKEFKDKTALRFRELCGFNQNNNIDCNRKIEAEQCFEKSFECLSAKGIYSFFDKNIFDYKNIFINRNILNDFFKSKVLGFVFFAVLASEVKKVNKGSILEEFYFEMTGNAVIDVARNFMKIDIENLFKGGFHQFCVSEAFGTGFFGIENDFIFEFFNLVDCSDIGLQLNHNGVLKPNKSFVGFFVISETPVLIKNDCKNCLGNKNGCCFCKNSL